MTKILPIKFLYSTCACCNLYPVCDNTSVDECSGLAAEVREKGVPFEPETSNAPKKTRLEQSLDRMDKLLDEQEKSIRRMCEILDKM